MTNWFSKSSVKLLSGADFSNKEPWKLNDKHCSVVLFFAEWCGHCQNIKQEYIKFADIAQFTHVYALDSERNYSLMESIKNSPLKIEGFPTIIFYKNGVPVKTYNGDRTWQDMVNTAMQICKK